MVVSLLQSSRQRPRIAAGLFALLLLIGAGQNAVAAPRCAGTLTLDQRIAVIEQQSAIGRARYRFTIEQGKGSSSRLFLIIRSTVGYEAAALLYLNGCEAPLDPVVLDPEETAQKHFGMPLAALFAEESEVMREGAPPENA